MAPRLWMATASVHVVGSFSVAGATEKLPTTARGRGMTKAPAPEGNRRLRVVLGGT
jgi:hypothetical protein